MPFQIGDSPLAVFLYLFGFNFHKCVSVAIFLNVEFDLHFVQS